MCQNKIEKIYYSSKSSEFAAAKRLIYSKQNIMVSLSAKEVFL